ncbi:MAG: hypothetical protein RLN60_04900 [Phycisphaerales bacterium]
MLIDRTHRTWGLASAAMVIIGSALYLSDPQARSQGHHGGDTWIGLSLGVVALAFMVFCSLLGLKRRVPHWRLGKAQTWLRGHIWLGLVAVWFVALHAAFATGGPITSWLWILLGFVTISALFGVGLQQTIPRLLLHSVQGETVAQLIGTELDSLRTTSQSLCEGVDIPGAQSPIKRFNEQYIAPYLSGQRGAELSRRSRAVSLFEGLRTMCPAESHETIEELRSVCERYRQLVRQRSLTRVLHAWLVIHVPISWGLLGLSFIHAAAALRYSAFDLGGLP